MKRNTIHMILAVATLTIAAFAAETKTVSPAVSEKDVENTAGAFLVKRNSTGTPERPTPAGGEVQPEWDSRNAKPGSPFERRLVKSSASRQATSSTVVITERPEYVDLVAASEPDGGSNKDASKAVIFNPAALMTSPLSGATLNPIQTFRWERPAGHVLFWAGSHYNGTDIAEFDLGGSTSTTIHVPTDGRTIYVCLWTHYNGHWYDRRYTYRAPSYRTPSTMEFPASGATLSTTQTFRWTPGSGVTDYWFQLGSCPDCADIFDSPMGRDTAVTVYNIPADGRVLYATVYSNIAGDWYYHQRSYRAPVSSYTRVRIEINNRLIYPITVSVDGRVIGKVPASTVENFDLSDSSFQVSYVVDHPRVNGRTFGDSMAGEFSRISNASGAYRFNIDNIIGTQHYFAPLITNRTASNQYIRVNGGLQSENTCGCYAAAYTTHVGSGYYRLFSNSNVMVSTNREFNGYTFWGQLNGRSTGEPLYKFVEEETGTLELTVR